MDKIELFDALSNIKEELFDASSEVKSAFNDVVKYFSVDYGESTVPAKTTSNVVITDDDRKLLAVTDFEPSFDSTDFFKKAKSAYHKLGLSSVGFEKAFKDYWKFKKKQGYEILIIPNSVVSGTDKDLIKWLYRNGFGQ